MKNKTHTEPTGTTPSWLCDDTRNFETIKKIAEELKPLLPVESRIIIDECVEQYERNDFVVMIAGEVSVGKSSLLNALLGKSILLTDLTETTAAITYLRSSEGDKTAKADMAKVTYNDGRIEWLELKKSSLMKVTTSLKNDDALKKVKKVDIYISGNIIPPGVTIVDTPGLNGGDKHSALTRREMGLCHAALFLLDASKAGTKTEQKELNYLYDYAPFVFFVLSKWDLVRKATPGLTLDAIKTRYLDSIGKITNDAQKGKVVSAENIFVVSAKEGLEATEAFIKYKKGKKRVTTSQRQSRMKKAETNGLRIRDFLPDKGKSNEIFDLFYSLTQILNQETRNRMVRLRPLLTMCNLAKAELEKLEQKLAHDVDTSKLDLSIAKLSNDMETRKDTIQKRNQGIVDRLIALANAEQKELLASIENTRHQVLSDISVSLQETSAFRQKNTSQLLSPAFHQSFQKRMNTILATRIMSPIQEKVNDFLTLLNNSFDSGEELTVNMPTNTAPSMDLSKIARKTQQITDDIQRIKNSQETIKNEINNLEKQYSDLLSDYEVCSNAKKKIQEIDKKITANDEERRKMGNRPGADQD